MSAASVAGATTAALPQPSPRGPLAAGRPSVDGDRDLCRRARRPEAGRTARGSRPGRAARRSGRRARPRRRRRARPAGASPTPPPTGRWLPRAATASATPGAASRRRRRAPSGSGVRRSRSARVDRVRVVHVVGDRAARARQAGQHRGGQGDADQERRRRGGRTPWVAYGVARCEPARQDRAGGRSARPASRISAGTRIGPSRSTPVKVARAAGDHRSRD